MVRPIICSFISGQCLETTRKRKPLCPFPLHDSTQLHTAVCVLKTARILFLHPTC